MKSLIKEYKFCFFASALVILFFVLRYFYAGFTGEENRYASVAWQMLQEHNWLVPRLGYGIYPDKPPLTYWLTILGWHVNQAWCWPLIVPAVFTIGIFFLTQKIAKLLLPEHKILQQLAPVLLLGMPYFVMHYGLVRFDMQLTFFNLLACYALLSFKQAPKIKWSLFAVANTLGVLAKGPVIYLFTVPELVGFAFAYSEIDRKQFLLHYGLAIVFSLLLCLLWVLPVLIHMGFSYAHHLIVEQIFMRVSSGHVGGSKPFWHYLPIVGLMVFPWVFFKNFWQAKSREVQSVSKFLLASIILPIVILSIVVSKQERYLLPLAPLLSIYIAACFSRLFGAPLAREKNNISISVLITVFIFFILGLVMFFAVQHDQHLNALYKTYFPRELGLAIAAISLVFLFLLKLDSRKQVVGLALLGFLVIAILQLGYLYAVGQARNLLPIAVELKKLQDQNIPVVSTDSLVNEMQYLGRLDAPVATINLKAFQHQWRLHNPNGWVLLTAENGVFGQVPKQCFSQVYRRMTREMLLCPVNVVTDFCDETTQSKCF